MSHDSRLPLGGLTLKQALYVLQQSKATFYRHYRPVPKEGELTHEEAEQIWDYFTHRLDIREAMIAGRLTLLLDRRAVAALAEANRMRSDASLATQRSAWADRLGECAKPGGGSKVLSDGRPRPPKPPKNTPALPVDCQR